MTTENKEGKQNPLRVAYYFIKYPCRIILLIFVIFLLAGVADYFGFQFNTTSTHSYFVLDDPQVNRKDQKDLAVEYLGQSSINILPKTQPENRFTLINMFKTRDGTNILTPSSVADYIEFIIETNNKIPDTDPDAYYSFCLADPTDPYSNYPDCSSRAVWDPLVESFGNNPTNISQIDIDNFVDYHLNVPQLRDSFLSCFEEDFEVTGNSQYYRFVFIVTTNKYLQTQPIFHIQK